MPTKKTTEELVSERPEPKELANLPRTPLIVLADNVRSLDNVGLLFRTCELARIEKLYLAGYTGYPGHSEKHDRRITKTAVYAVPHQPWEHVPDPVPLVEQLKSQGHQIIVLEQTDSSQPYHKIENYQLPAVLVLGHERQGVRQELVDLADIVVEIPILGLGNSHNVAIAGGIIISHILDKTGTI